MRQAIRTRTQRVLFAGAARVRPLRWRLLGLIVGGLAAIGVVAGVAVARTGGGASTIGTGAVVIDTTVGYQGGSAAGTGMVLTSSGEVLTNNHVIRGATSIKIAVPGTNHTYTAKVVGYDVADDVAVLQAAGASNLNTIETAASSAVAVGDAVTAVGNADGTGKLTSATGSITGVQKAIVVSDDQGGTESLSGLIETDAGLQRGDSGGPLFNSAGKVIGMDTAASTGYVFRSTATDGYAIPIANALSIAKQIESGQASTRVHVGSTAFLGIEVQSAGAPGGSSSPGALVSGVVPGGPAASAGLSAGDTITAIDDHTVSSSSITSALLTKKPGSKVEITYTDQSGASHSVSVRLAGGPAQ
ncbi:MAG: PDZ domain-containing protein [Actinobacteria bacterium]|nr:MAG: PDZ domain-containing protein [Actinomycetota bacterium]